MLASTCLALAIYFEARSEPVSGQLAVAYTVQNRVADKRWPDNTCDVVWQRRQFSWTHDGKSDKPKDVGSWVVAQHLANAVLAGEINFTATHYHADWIDQPSWAKRLNRIGKIGRHIFYE